MKLAVKEIRKFNRFYTSHLGLLNKHFLETSYSITEMRVLYEIGESKDMTAQYLKELLNLDKGYISRIINVFKKRELLERKKSLVDKRLYYLQLTKKGKELLAILQEKSDQQIEKFTEQFSKGEERMLVNSMRSIQTLLVTSYDNNNLAKEVSFREGLNPGDIGYLIYLHGILYAKESGYSSEFEGYVVKTFYEFLERYSPEHDRIWLAEYNSQIIGCIAILHHSTEQAQLRWFLTDPTFRGAGVGKKLLTFALDYCKESTYKNVFLLTTSIQKVAIEMYKKNGFIETESVKLMQWGKMMHEERFDLFLNE